MKKLYLLLFMGFCHYSFGQTYSFDLYYSVPTQKYCWDGQYGFSIRGGAGNAKISEQIKNKIHYVEDVYEEYFSVPNYSQFKITIKSTCFSNNGTSSCDGDETRTVSAISLIKNGSVALYRCVDESLKINKFRPNVTIQNLDTANPSNVCAGSQLGLAAFPGGFPDEAYHWQYSLNSITWIDVPAFIGTKKTNDSKTTSFTMQELLGDNHVNYINKPIYFRLGYDQTKAFTDPLTMTYLACAPLVNNIEYLAPLCFGDNVRDVTVTFDRDLYSGEELRYFQLKAVDPVTNFPDGTPSIIYPFFSEDDPNNGLITKFDEKSSGVYTYSLLNFKGLNPNATYQIQYQAFQNNVTRGISISPETENFKYIEPATVKFEIKKADNPKCTDDLVEISIAVTGGTGDYKFYVDGIEKTNPKPVKEADEYYHLRGLIPTAINNIKVMDKNDCIEKTP